MSPLKIDKRITKNAYHFYTVRIHEDKLKGISRDRFIEGLQAEGLPICLGYTPLYRTSLITSDYTKKQVKGPISHDLSSYPNTEFAYKHECAWIYSSDEHLLLSERKAIDAIADSFLKVYENIEELR